MAVGLSSTSLAGVTASITRETLRNQMKTSMFGRRAGMDFNDYEVGEQDTRLPIDFVSATSSGITLSPNGFSVLACTVGNGASGTTAVVCTLTGAVPGIYKQITQICSSTGIGSGTSAAFVVQFGPNAQIITTLGSSFNQIAFASFGHTINLCCISTGSSIGSSAGGGGVWISASPGTVGGFSTY